jgi:formylglycine-generating enzyme required for sulfatase activity
MSASVQSDVDYFMGLAGVVEIAPFLPDDAELQRWAVLTETYPKIDVVAADGSSGAQVFVRAIDPFDGTCGEKIGIGQLPIHGAPIAPGYSRIVVERDGAFSEITRLFVDRSAPYEIVAWLRPPDEIRGDMIPISGGRFRLGNPVPNSDPSQDVVFGVRDFDVADFSIGRTELSNADYRRYMDDVARRSPPIQVHRPEVWPDPWDPKWDRLPVTDITVVEAALYAEWAGTRLPTAAEWERASRGPNGYLFPWGNENPQLVLTIGNVERFAPPEWNIASLRADFLKHVQPVDETESGAIGPEGLLHTLGNVAEWTESPALYVIDGRPSALPFQWQAKGYTFHVNYPRAARDGLATQTQYPQPGCNSTTGFRCAKSRVP